MDISVSRLNNRLALQLPAELPLGLVFVVGEVDNLVAHSGDSAQESNGRPRARFDLVEANYRLRCRLTPRATPDEGLREGDTVRVGGHLTFDSHWADYFLMVRDVEVIGEPAAGDSSTLAGEKRAALASALADVKKRAEAARLAPAELPTWVQKIAPPEVQAALEAEAAGRVPVETAAADVPAEAPLSSELVEFAAAAIESEEEVELKPEIIEKLAPASVPPRLAPPPGRTLAAETVAAAYRDVDRPAPDVDALLSRRHETDWLVILLIFSFLILTAAVVVASVLLLIR